MLLVFSIGFQIHTVSANSIVLSDTTPAPAPSTAPVDSNCQDPGTSTPQPVAQNCIFVKYVDPAIRFLSAGVGVVVVAMVIVGAVQYSASAGNPQALAAARKRIINALLALLVFALIFSFLNFLIPGGLLSL